MLCTFPLGSSLGLALLLPHVTALGDLFETEGAAFEDERAACPESRGILAGRHQQPGEALARYTGGDEATASTEDAGLGKGLLIETTCWRHKAYGSIRRTG